jgi:phage terminase large subunit-like protein
MPDYYFDHAVAEAAVEFFPRYLRHSKGEFAGQPFRLSDWQIKDVIAPFFGTRDRKTGLRRYRTCWLELPRKNGKSTLCAGVSILALLADGEYGGEVYTAGTDKNQARIVFNESYNMIRSSPELLKHCELFKQSIYCGEFNASMRPLSADAKNKDGLNSSALIMDEVHAYRDRSLYDVLHTSQGARTQPIEFMATTAGNDKKSFGWEMHEYALKVRAGVIDDPTLLVCIYGAETSDDWKIEPTWRKANPGYGISVQPSYLADEAKKAEEIKAYENTFRQMHLNQWVEQATRRITAEEWNACTGDVSWDELEEFLAGRECHAGLDLASTTDLTALILVFPPQAHDEPYYILCRFFVPEENMDKRARRDRVNYPLWHKGGALQATDGNVVDYRAIRVQLEQDRQAFDIRSIGYDPWNASQIALELQDEGFPMFEFRQGMSSMAGPTREFLRLVSGKMIVHGGHPVLAWNASNLATRTDPAGNEKPDKERSGERIDGIVGAIMGVGRATAEEVGSGKSVYESRGIRVI